MNPFAGLMAPMVDRPCVSRSEQVRKARPAALSKVKWPPRGDGKWKRLDFPAIANPWGLTPMQCEVMNLRTQGGRYVAIASKLKITAKSVWSHLDVVRKKMDVEQIREAEKIWGRWARKQPKAEAVLFDGNAPGGDLQVRNAEGFLSGCRASSCDLPPARANTGDTQ